MGIDLMTLDWRSVATVALQIVIISGLAYFVIRTLTLVARRFEERLGGAKVDAGRRARVRTLMMAATASGRVIIVVVAILTFLAAIGINIAPILAGFGVVGLAVSLGTQVLIRDFIGGLLILIEDQFHVGDVIQVGTTSGKVESISLRATYLRDTEGRLWVIPNGEVRVVCNATRGWARAVVDITVPSTDDVTRTMSVLETAMQMAGEDAEITDDILDPPQVQGYSGLSETSVQIRLIAKTVAGRQWNVARVLRRYALTALQKAGVEDAQGESSSAS